MNATFSPCRRSGLFGKRPLRGRRLLRLLRLGVSRADITIGTWRAARVEQEDLTEDETREALLQLDFSRVTVKVQRTAAIKDKMVAAHSISA